MASRHGYVKLGYADKTDIENYLLLDIDSSFDSQVDDWIITAEKYVNNYLGYTTASGILREAITEEKTQDAIVDSEGDLMIFPSKTPIVSISAISLIKGTDSLDLTLTTGDENRYNMPTSADYILYPASELSLSGVSIISSFWDIKGTKFLTKMNYIAGFAEVPADIRQATVNIASDYIMRHTNKEGLESITQGRMAKRWKERVGGESDFIKDAEKLLKPYKLSQKFI